MPDDMKLDGWSATNRDIGEHVTLESRIDWDLQTDSNLILED